jgi:hypothetical protein
MAEPSVLDTVKTFIDIISGIVTAIVAFSGALLAVGVWAIARVPKVRLQQVFWFPETPQSDTPYPISMQFQFFSGAIGSKVVTEILIDTLSLEQPQHYKCQLTPFTFLDPIEIDPKRKIGARPKQFSQAFLMQGSEDIVKHIGFHFDAEQEKKFKPAECEEFTIKLEVKYKIYDPIRKALSLLKICKSPIQYRGTYIYERTIDHKEVEVLSKKQSTIWPFWHVKEKRELQYDKEKMANKANAADR